MGEDSVVNGVWVKADWEIALETAIALLMGRRDIRASISEEHVRNTPLRVVEAFKEYFSGLDQDPEEVLKGGFEETKYDEMIYVKNIGFVSFCGHHLIPFLGKVHFAYIPDKKIVGLSKIARLVDIYARRPQVQEQLTVQIVDTFSKVVKPKGCGVVIDAVHMCMMVRGVRKETAVTRTTALRDLFYHADVKSEFLDGVKDRGSVWL